MSLLFEEKLHINDLFYLLIIFASIGLCLTSKFILNKEMTRVSYLVVNILVSNAIIKLLIVGYCIFNKMMGMEATVTDEALASHLLVVNGLQLSSIVIVSGLLMGKVKHALELWNGLNIVCICLLAMIKKYSISWSSSISVMIKCTCVVGMCGLLGLSKWWKKQLPQEDVYFYKLFLFVCVIKVVLSIVSMLTQLHFDITLAILSFSEWILLFIYCYLTCVINPWKNKKRLLAEAGYCMALQREQSEHIVGLSHELKTPVNVIRSALDLMLLEEKIERSDRVKLTALKDECGEIINIVQNMIDIQKIEGKHMNSHPKVCNLVEVIENVIEAFSSESECELLFNPLEEEIFQEVDIHLVQQSFMLFISLLIRQGRDCPIYIEMGKRCDKNEGATIKIQHDGVVFLEKISSNLYEFNVVKENEIELLTMQLIELIFSLQRISMQYFLEGNKKILELRFPICNEQTEEWLDEENVEVLKEQIKARGLVRSL